MQKGFAHLVRPPKFWAKKIERRNSVGGDGNFPGLVRSQRHFLRKIESEAATGDFPAQNSVDWRGSSTVGKSPDGEVCNFGLGQIQTRFDNRMAERHRPSCGDDDLLPKAHIFVGWSGIPVHPGDAELVGS